MQVIFWIFFRFVRVIDAAHILVIKWPVAIQVSWQHYQELLQLWIVLCCLF